MVSQNTDVGSSFVFATNFNTDDFLDRAVSNYSENTTSVLLGNGNDGFG